MAKITTSTNENGEKLLNVDLENDTEVTLATANTYVDKNIIVKLNSNVDVATVDETLAFLNIIIPDLTEEEF